MNKPPEEIAQLQAAIKALEAQRSMLGDAVVEVSLKALKQQLSELLAAGTCNMNRNNAYVQLTSGKPYYVHFFSKSEHLYLIASAFDAIFTLCSEKDDKMDIHVKK